jgi:hypothetical protein
VGLKTDGTVVAVGHNEYGECAVSRWTDITQVATSFKHTVGLKADGTAIATGDNTYGQCNVGGWTDIIQVTASNYNTVGRKADGTVVAVGGDAGGQYAISSWTDITQIAAGSYHIVGRKANGTVVAAGPDIELAKWNLGVVEYSLNISSTAGGSITTPGEGAFTYNAGMMVHVVAEPKVGYRFVNWTGDVDTIFDVSAATTVITMHGDYEITANFEEKPSVNWPLIGGITAAAVVAVGLVIFFMRRRRAAGTKRQGRRRTTRRRRR